MKYKFISILVLLFCSKAFSQSYQPVYVSEWVIEPSAEELHKPLIFVDFWATWCGPCINSMSYTEVLADNYKDDILFMYVSNELSEKVASFMDKYDKTFYSAVDNTNSNINNFNVKSLPFSVLLGNDGEILWVGKPTDITTHILDRYLKKSRNLTYNNNWYNLLDPINHKIVWDVYARDSVSINYLESQNISNDISVQENEYVLSGDMNYLTSVVFNVPIQNIVVDNNISFIFSSKHSQDVSVDLIKSFLYSKYEFADSVKVAEVYELTGGKKELFLNANTNDFEKGDNAVLADEASIIIDNCTITSMLETISGYSEYTFVYNGEDQEIYDWNILLLNDTYLIDQFKEFGFITTKESIDQHFMYVK